MYQELFKNSTTTRIQFIPPKKKFLSASCFKKFQK